jgi:ATP-dependent exoDNAse (exonuclease V) beta subunit
VEIARRVHRLAREEGVAFDQVAILLRSPERYQPMVEDALRRAGVPAYFSHGSARPDPGGRAFLALLACASERLSASRFAEYLSLGTGFRRRWLLRNGCRPRTRCF